MEIWGGLMYVVLAMVSVIGAIRQAIVKGVIHRNVDTLCGFVSWKLGRLWLPAHQGRAVVDLQNIVEELKTQIIGIEAENEVLREKNGAMEKQVVHLQKRKEELSDEIKELKTESKELKLETKESNIGEEGAITLGPWGGNGGRYWAYKLDVAPIMQITLGYGSVIDSILITSKSRDGKIIGCSNRFGGPGGEYATLLCFDSSVEQLTAISVTYGDWCGMRLITSLSFYSNRGVYGPYGTVFGCAVSIPVEGAILAGFHGRGGLYLDAFGVLVAKSTQ